MQSNVIASAHLKVFVNGRLLGWASGCNPRISSPVRAIYGVDSSVANEISPTIYDVSGTIQVFRGRWQGGVEGLGMAAYGEKLLNQKYSTIEVLDRVSDSVVYKFINCLVGEQSWTISPKQLVVGTFSFKGLTFSNEADQ